MKPATRSAETVGSVSSTRKRKHESEEKTTGRLRILIVEREPTGSYQTLPDLSVLDSATDPIKLRPVDLRLLQAAATYPCLYHRGPHSGAVASHLVRRFPKALTRLRTAESESTKTVPSDADDDDALIVAERSKADYVIHAVCVDAESDEDLGEFVEHVHQQIQKPKSERETDPDSDGSVHPDAERVGHLQPSDAGWEAFYTFWSTHTPDEVMDLADEDCPENK